MSKKGLENQFPRTSGSSSFIAEDSQPPLLAAQHHQYTPRMPRRGTGGVKSMGQEAAPAEASSFRSLAVALVGFGGMLSNSMTWDPRCELKELTARSPIS